MSSGRPAVPTGPLTLCCNLRGARGVASPIYSTTPTTRGPMLAFVAETTMKRIKAYRQHAEAEMKPERGGLADDSIQLISTALYKEMILPFHRRHLNEMFGAGPHGMHLCGDATRHFKTIRDELNVYSFDTGYPVDFGALRKSLGPRVEIYGGPKVPFLEIATPDAVREETRRILKSGITEGGKFVLREANNLPPGIPTENLWAMWDAVHEFGNYV